MEPLGLNNFQVRPLSSFPQEVDSGTSGAGASLGAGGPGGWQGRAVYFSEIYIGLSFLSFSSCPICVTGLGMGIDV